jgi:hypothetical protein
MTHLLSFLLFIHFFHTEYPLLIEMSLLRSYVLFFLLLLLLFIFIYGGLHLAFQHNQPCLKRSSIPLDIVKHLMRGRTVTVQYLDSNGWTVTIQCLDSNDSRQ